MSIITNIREKIADAILPSEKRNKKPYNNGKGYKSTISLPTGNELQMSLRGTVFACLQLRANALSSVKFETFKEQAYGKDELSTDHWTSKLISNPNPFFTHSQVWTFIENWLSINGNCFIWTPTLGYKVPLQMWVLNPTRTRVLLGGDNFVEGYVYQSINDGNIFIPEKEVIHLAKVRPTYKPDEIIGMNVFGTGLVTAALDYANIDVEVSEYLHRFFSNNTIPPLIATHQDQVDSDVWEKLKARWNEEMPDYKLRALLGGGLNLQLPPRSDLGISYDAVSKDTRAQISQVFGVPSGMLTGEYQNRATAEIQFAIFRQNTIDPEALYIAEEFTRHFKRFEDDILIEALPYTYVDADTEMRKEEFELKWGMKTINEARKDRGYDLISDGNVPLLANGFVPLNSILVGAPVAKTFSYDLETRNFPLHTAEAKDIFWRKFDKLTTKNELEIQSIVKEVVNDLKTQVMSDIENGKIALNNLTMTDKQLEEFNKRISESCEKVLLLVVDQIDVKKSDLSGEVNKQIQEFTQQTTQQISESYGLMVDELRNTINLNAGSSPDELKKILDDKFETLSTSRAQMIAETTSANVTSGMQYTVYKDQGFKMAWLTKRDGRVRPSHSAVDGKLQNADGYFIVSGYKAKRPLDPKLPAGEIVRCRCQLFPVKS